jgi:hypothetical protein
MDIYGWVDMIALESSLIVSFNIPIGTVMLPPTETAMNTLQPPISILFQEPILLVVLNHIRDNSPATTTESISTQMSTILNTDPIKDSNLSFGQTIESCVYIIGSHPSGKTVLTTC